MKLGFLGCGTIASAVVAGIAEQGHDIRVSQRNAHHAQALAQRFENVQVSDNAQLLAESDWVVVGLLPEVAQVLLPQLSFRPDHQVISMMAALSLQDVQVLIGPAQARAIMLPFPSIAHGPSPVLAQGDVSAVAAILGRQHPVFDVHGPEGLKAYLSAQAILSPMAELVNTTAQWMRDHGVNPNEGEAFLRALLASNLQAGPCTALVQALDTPGGFNQRMRLHVQASGLPSQWLEGLSALHRTA